ncbi:nickel/cobalt transporter [Rhodoplanes roseus]|nr:nickel transporter [Rhodoplanes roseus]
MRPRTLWIAGLALAVLAVAAGADVALAQGTPFGVRPPAPPPPPVSADGIVGWILTEQARFYRSLSGLVRAAKQDGSAVWTLLGVSFLYGIFHAAGPGHGKAVISSYMIANEETWKRGIVLSFASALLQAVVAVAVVAVAAIALNATAKSMNEAVRWIEVVSYGLIALVGARLVWVKGRGLVRALAEVRATRARAPAVAASPSPALAPAAPATVPAEAREPALAGLVHAGHAHAPDRHHDHHSHDHHDHGPHDHAHGDACGCGHDHHDHHGDHDHHHDHGHAVAAARTPDAVVTGPVAHAHHDHDHDHVHGPDCGCAHGPDPKDLAGPGGWSRGLAAIVAVGLRPCSGAILVLVFALAQGLFWAGVGATFAMGLGTAITVAVIATIAVGARAVAARLARHRAGRGEILMWGVELAAACGVLLFGVALLAGYMVTERMI